jgi:hypothetical protein
MTGIREMEIVHLFWRCQLSTEDCTRDVEAGLGVLPEALGGAEVPIPVELIDLVKPHTSAAIWYSRHRRVIASTMCWTTERQSPSAQGSTRRYLISKHFDRHTLRGHDGRASMFGTVQHWMRHKSLQTTMRYLVPSKEVHLRLDEITVPGLDEKQARRERLQPGNESADKAGRSPKQDSAIEIRATR